MRFVLDNSVVVRWLLADGVLEAIDYANQVLTHMQDPHTVALVPGFWALEVGNVIARAEAKGFLREARSAEILGILQDMAIETAPHTTRHALADTLQLARRYQLSTYDAAYLELALRAGLPLASNDAALKKALLGAGGTLV